MRYRIRHIPIRLHGNHSSRHRIPEFSDKKEHTTKTSNHLAPTTLLLKILYQQLLEVKIDRDAEAPQEIQKAWTSVMAELNEFAKLRIPPAGRHISAQVFEREIFRRASLWHYVSS
ncbi:hypothetical protein OUZ56_012717 [Daphnia magna]|uniref:Uncharacterized protein n=1 Tax=Daphnia magna TaxID=35525 RepID=A0ABQ9Z3U4_9CRUS|nr:hypothetical protein OUZ56_012717 [Daphnia magna]